MIIRNKEGFQIDLPIVNWSRYRTQCTTGVNTSDQIYNGCCNFLYTVDPEIIALDQDLSTAYNNCKNGRALHVPPPPPPPSYLGTSYGIGVLCTNHLTGANDTVKSLCAKWKKNPKGKFSGFYTAQGQPV